MTRKNFRRVLVLRILPKTSFKFLSTSQSSPQTAKRSKFDEPYELITYLLRKKIAIIDLNPYVQIYIFKYRCYMWN